MSAALLVALLVLAGTPQAAVDRTKPPAPGPAPSLKLPPLQKQVLSNGLPVFLTELHEVPLAVVQIQVRSGAMADPPGQPGLADLTASLLTEGAAGKSALAIADAADYVGVRLLTGASWDASTARVFTPVARLDAALEILADVLLRPDFPGDELGRKRQERLTAFLQRRDEPRSVATAAYQKVLFGSGHRFGVDLLGTETFLRVVSREDLVRFYRTHYAPGNAACIVVGDVTAASVLPRLEKAFSSWKGDAPAAAAIAPPPQVRGREIILVDKPGAAQSELRFVRVGVPRSTPDFYALEVLNTILGGSFTSRLNDNLREQHGYSYGASSAFLMRRAPGPFIAAAAVATAVTDKAVAEVMTELRRIREPVSPDELARAKNYLTLSYPSGFETTSQLAAKLSEQVLYQLPDDFFNSYADRIRAVTVEDAARVARTYIDPDRLVVVVVGDRKQVEPALVKLSLGAIRVLTADEVFDGPKGAGGASPPRPPR